MAGSPSEGQHRIFGNIIYRMSATKVKLVQSKRNLQRIYSFLNNLISILKQNTFLREIMSHFQRRTDSAVLMRTSLCLSTLVIELHIRLGSERVVPIQLATAVMS